MAKIVFNGVVQVEKPFLGFTYLTRQYRAVKTGKNNLIVTIPREWCESNGIKAGDNLTLAYQDNILVVQSGK
jgi:hypothetical protein